MEGEDVRHSVCATGNGLVAPCGLALPDTDAGAPHRVLTAERAVVDISPLFQSHKHAHIPTHHVYLACCEISTRLICLRSEAPYLVPYLPVMPTSAIPTSVYHFYERTGANAVLLVRLVILTGPNKGELACRGRW